MAMDGKRFVGDAAPANPNDHGRANNPDSCPMLPVVQETINGGAGSMAFYRYLHRLTRLQDALIDGPLPRFEFSGDGVPRTLDGTPFEPLDWKGIKA